MFKSIEIDLRVFVTDFQLLANLIIEIFKQLLPRLAHRLVDLEAQFELQLIERRLDQRMPEITVNGHCALQAFW